jgi:hypothetical protein
MVVLLCKLGVVTVEQALMVDALGSKGRTEQDFV